MLAQGLVFGDLSLAYGLVLESHTLPNRILRVGSNVYVCVFLGGLRQNTMVNTARPWVTRY